jgi:hypothetical protein
VALIIFVIKLPLALFVIKVTIRYFVIKVTPTVVGASGAGAIVNGWACKPCGKAAYTEQPDCYGCFFFRLLFAVFPLPDRGGLAQWCNIRCVVGVSSTIYDIRTEGAPEYPNE